MKITANAAPVISLAEGLQRSLEIGKGRVNLGDLTSELVRVEIDDRSAITGELAVTFYPSDAFLGLASAI
jgi:hypothetical protein